MNKRGRGHWTRGEATAEARGMAGSQRDGWKPSTSTVQGQEITTRSAQNTGDM